MLLKSLPKWSKTPSFLLYNPWAPLPTPHGRPWAVADPLPKQLVPIVIVILATPLYVRTVGERYVNDDLPYYCSYKHSLLYPFYWKNSFVDCTESLSKIFSKLWLSFSGWSFVFIIVWDIILTLLVITPFFV